MSKLTRFLWGAALMALPVTSFRYFPGMGEGTLVRPLAFYPIALLLPLLVVQWFRGKTTFPRAGALTPLAGFVLVVLAASSFGAWLDPIPLRGQEYFGRVIRAWATLVIGISFFIAAVWMNRNEDDLKFSVRWILAGFALDVAWSGVQALAFYTPILPKVMVTHWQLAFSMRELVKTNRVSGMAYEPAWLAGQIATVYLPWLFASLLTGVRVTRFKWLEIILLGFAGLLILATYSRGGLLTAGAATALTFLLVGRAELRSTWTWFVSKSLILRAGVLTLAIGAILGAGLFLAQKGYIARMFESDAESVEEFVVENSAGARLAGASGLLLCAQRLFDHHGRQVGHCPLPVLPHAASTACDVCGVARPDSICRLISQWRPFLCFAQCVTESANCAASPLVRACPEIDRRFQL